jgi:putative ubiquitin-RnfH superfamily antitoxin RatB of RatAB toxin-antitoxin module
MAEAQTGMLEVVFCWSLKARQVHEYTVNVPAGSTVQSATAHWMGLGLSDIPSEDLSRLPFLQPGIWGRKVAWTHPLRSGDRIEFYRELKVDPKVARRQRFKRQGKGRTGLFANRKTGSAAGY